MFPLDLGDHPFPEAERLGVRVVDAENPHALFDPEFEDAAQFLPQCLPVVAFEIERIDVLVLLRRDSRRTALCRRAASGTIADARSRNG